MKIKFISKYADWLYGGVKKVILNWYKKLQIFTDNDMHWALQSENVGMC